MAESRKDAARERDDAARAPRPLPDGDSGHGPSDREVRVKVAPLDPPPPEAGVDDRDVVGGLGDDDTGGSRAQVTVARVVVPVLFAAAGFLFVTSGTNAGGTDLRAERQTDIAGLVRSHAVRNRALAAEVSELRAEVDALGQQLAGASADEARGQADRLAPVAGLTAAHGPGVVVTLDDAPPSARVGDIDPDGLIVHQQDIQAVVNALRAGGAEALSIQGQRVISTSAIRCVGNSVVLHGVPYPPPYTVAAIGPVDTMVAALGESPGVRTYLDYVERAGLGYELEQDGELEIPAFEGALELSYARPQA